jgi:hypothetical protein
MTEQQQCLVEAAREVARRLGGGKLSLSRFKAETRMPLSRIYAAFPAGWTQLCIAAGVAAAQPYYRLTDHDIFQAMRRAFEAQGGVTTCAAFQRHFTHGLNVFRRRGMTWGQALVAFRAWALVHAPDFPYLDQLPAAAPPPRNRRGVTERALDERLPDDAPPARELGPRIDFRGLMYGPINEQGVVFLFGIVAQDLGFAVETLGVRFPDCEAKLRLASGGWRHVRIEFEFKARNFLAHDHLVKGCDLIVCWENDWPDAPIPVIALRDEIERLAKLDAARAVEKAGKR